MKKKRTRLTAETARQLREIAHIRGWSARRIAHAAKLPERTVQHVIRGHTFPDAGGPLRPQPSTVRRLTAKDAARIRRLKGTRSSPDLANEYDCSESLIRHVWTGRCHA